MVVLAAAAILLLPLFVAHSLAHGHEADPRTQGGSHEALFAWAKSRGAVVSPSISVQATPDRGRGVFAQGDLPTKSTVFAIPLSLAMNVEHALVDQELGRLWEMLPDLSDLEVMAGFLALEALRGDGYWQPYVDALGPVPITPTTYSEEEMDALAPSAAVHAIAEQRHRDLTEVYELIVKAAQDGLNPEEQVAWRSLSMSKSDYLWAHVVLRSRSHKLAVRDAVGQWHDAMCLIPLADLFNTNLHNNSANVACYTGSEGYGTMSVFYCETTRPISDGDELLAEYISDASRRSSGKLLLDYGFVPESHDTDSVLIQLPKLSTAAEDRLKRFNFRDYEPLPYLPSEKECEHLRLALYFAIAFLDEEGADISNDFKVNDHLLADRVRDAGMEGMLQHLTRLLRAYPGIKDPEGTTSTADEGAGEKGGVRAEVRAAIGRLQRNERRIIQHALDMCSTTT